MMNNFLNITSFTNKNIKFALSLKNNNKRRKQKYVFIEGREEVEKAFICPFLKVKHLYICDHFLKTIHQQYFQKRDFKNMQCYKVSKNIFEKISYRHTPDGVIAIAQKECFLEAPIETLKKIIRGKKEVFLLILEDVEKPGNIGAIMRTAEASNVDAIIINDTGKTIDIFNPNIIRASLGTVFEKPICILPYEKIKLLLNMFSINVFVTTPDAKKNYVDNNFINNAAIVMGSEKEGVNERWKKDFYKNLITIPMLGKIDSLNVSVASAIIMYEVVRQRQNN